MAEFTLRQKIEQAEAEVEDLQNSYLRKHGWESTCNTPGSYWLWRRDFADEDARRAEWDRAHDAGKPGRPSISHPYGIITAPTDLARSITERVLDHAIDQDGEPDTPRITLEDLAEA